MLNIQKNLSNSFFAILSLPSTAMGFALSIQISALSWILNTKYHLEIDEIGIVWAAGPIAGILGQVIIGLISDNVWFWKGRRRPFIIIGGTLAALSLLALPNMDIINSSMGLDGIFGIAITVALFLDISINISFNPTRSIIADVTPPAYRTKGYTWMQAISGSLGVGAYAIGAVFDKYTLIYLGVFLVFACSVLPTFFIEEPRTLAAEDDDNQAGGPNDSTYGGKGTQFVRILTVLQPLWGLLLFAAYRIPVKLLKIEVSHFVVEYICLALTVVMGLYVVVRGASKEDDMREFQKILLAHAFTWVGVQSMFIYMFAYIKDQIPVTSDNEVGVIIDVAFLILNAMGALVPIALLPLTKKIGRNRTHMLSIALMAASYAAIALFAKSATMLYILMAIAGVGWGATVSLPFAAMSDRIPKSKLGLYMGIFNLSVVLPQLVASLQVGEVIEASADRSITFYICAVCLGVSALLWLLVRESKSGQGNSSSHPAGGH